MKKRFFLLTAMAAVLFSGCQQEDDFRSMSADSQDITKVIITAELESTKATRTSTVSDGTGVNILWSEDDSLSVLMNGLKSHALFTIHDIDEKGTSAHFIGQNVIISGGTSGSDAADAANVAIYPYTADANITDKAYNAETGEHSFCMQFPHVQQYAAGGSVGNRALPMVAVSESTYHVGFGFRPLGSSIIIGLKGADSTKIKTIMMQSSKQKISGKAAVTASYAGMPTIAIDQTEGVNNIVLDCGEEGVALNPETFTQFTLALPPITVEENELTFTIYDTEGGFMEYVFAYGFTFERNMHYTMNQIGTYVATETNPLVLALKNAGEGDVVNFTLASDMKVTSQLSVGWESLNLDLNGFTLDLGDNALRFDGGYAFTSSVINIKNGTIKSNYNYCIFSYGIPVSITLTDVTLEGKGGIQVQGIAKNLTLNNVTMNVTGNGLNETLAHTQNSKVTINGGTYKVGTLFKSFEQTDDITIIGGKFNKTYTHKNVVWESREGEADADVYPYTAARQPYEVDAEGNATIYAAAGLKWLAEQVNGGTSFKGLTVKLANDIDLAGEEWTPIGLNGKRFMGTFDGAGKTISNLYISTADNGAQAALFGNVNSATIKNFTVDSAKVLYPANYSDDFYGAAVVSQAYHVNIEGVTVINSTIQGNNKVAAILAHDADGSAMTISNCHVDKCVIETKNEADGGNAAGIVGSVQGSSNTKSLTGCSVKNTTFNVVNSADAGKRSNAQMVATVIATDATVLTLTDCVVEGNTFNQTGVTDYVTPYDGIFVGGARTDVTGKVIVNGVTYPKSPIYIGETGYATLAEACAAAVNGDVIVISEGEFTLPYGLNHDNSGKLTIKGAGKEKTNILGTKNSYNNSGLPGNYANGMELLFEDLTYTTVNEGYYGGFGHADSVAFNKCKIVGQMYCHSGAPHTFTDCTIDPLTGYLYTYASDCVFTGCDFEASEGKALQVYAEAAGTFKTTITNCTFTAAKQAQTWDWKPVTGIDVNSANGAVMVVEVTDCSQEGFPEGLNSNSALWNVKSTTADITVTVDGKKVWPVENFTFDEETKTYTVLTPAGLSEALSAAGAAGAGNSTIEISGDLNMEGVEWTPIKVDGYNGADIVTVEGNGAKITNLSAPLFDGGFAGGSGIVIKNLTIADSEIVVTDTQGGGSFINCADSMDEITLINCHAENVTLITPNDGADESRLGGLIGWTAGYNNQNDGPVDSYITVKNCSVKDCNIKCAGSVGGIIGHSGANAATFTTIENCTVTGNTLTSTDDGGWRVGVVVGTANNGQTTITGITESGNTVAQTGKTAPEGEKRNYFGRFVPAGTGSLTIDGTWYVTSATELLNGLGEDVENIKLVGNVALAGESIEIAAGKTVVLDLNGQTISQTSSTPVSMITNNGNLTISDSNGSGKIEFTFNGEVNNNIAANAISNRGTLVVEGGVISNTGTGNQIGYAIDNYNGATLTVKGGTISASGSSYYDGIRLFCGNKQTTVTVEGGTISTIWAQNPSANKATEVYGTVIVDGGNISTIYYENYTTVKVKTGVSTTVSAYGTGKENATTATDGDYTVYSFNQ